jgi:diacylglycerol kinase (ATP)
MSIEILQIDVILSSNFNEINLSHMVSKKNTTPFSLKKRATSFKYAAKGFKYIIKHEHNFRIHLVLMTVAIVLSIVLKIERTEWLIILLTIAIVLITEIINSAIEVIVDLVSPNFNEKAGIAKDLAASAVLLASIIAAFIGFFIFFPKILAFCKLFFQS